MFDLPGVIGSALIVLIFGDRSALEGRLTDPALGGGGGRQPGLAALQPLARSLPADLGPPWKNPAKSAVARKLLIAAWHMLSRSEPFKPHQPAPASSGCFLTA